MTSSPSLRGAYEDFPILWAEVEVQAEIRNNSVAINESRSIFGSSSYHFSPLPSNIVFYVAPNYSESNYPFPLVIYTISELFRSVVGGSTTQVMRAK
jgi:hypothetical protein